jgi:hypothetical protein
MFSNIYNGISEFLRPLKLLVTKVSAEVGFYRLFSHSSTYSEFRIPINKNMNVMGVTLIIDSSGCGRSPVSF